MNYFVRNAFAHPWRAVQRQANNNKKKSARELRSFDGRMRGTRLGIVSAALAALACISPLVSEILWRVSSVDVTLENFDEALHKVSNAWKAADASTVAHIEIVGAESRWFPSEHRLKRTIRLFKTFVGGNRDKVLNIRVVDETVDDSFAYMIKRSDYPLKLYPVGDESQPQVLERVLANSIAESGQANDVLFQATLHAFLRRILPESSQGGSVLAAFTGIHEHESHNLRQASRRYLDLLVIMCGANLTLPINGLSTLHYAALKRDIPLTQKILKAGGNPSATDKNKRTPLHYAARHSDIYEVETFKSILRRPPPDREMAGKPIVPGGPTFLNSLNATFARRSMLIESYSERLDAELIGILVASGANVNALDRFGATPLHAASWVGSRAAVEALLSYAADPQIKESHHGQTAAHVAASRGFTVICKMLIEAGTSPDARDQYGRSIEHYARIHKNLHLLKFLNATENINATEKGAHLYHHHDCPDIAWLNMTGRTMTREEFKRDYASLRRPVLLHGEFFKMMSGKDFLTRRELSMNLDSAATFQLNYVSFCFSRARETKIHF